MRVSPKLAIASFIIHRLGWQVGIRLVFLRQRPSASPPKRAALSIVGARRRRNWVPPMDYRDNPLKGSLWDADLGVTIRRRLTTSGFVASAVRFQMVTS